MKISLSLNVDKATLTKTGSPGPGSQVKLNKNEIVDKFSQWNSS